MDSGQLEEEPAKARIGSRDKFLSPEAEVNAKMLKAVHDRIDAAIAEMHAIAKAAIPAFHFMDHWISKFWHCEKSSIGWCVFWRDWNDPTHPGVPDECIFCGQPVERK